jgi:dTDP-glucose 4,6-dehydratase
VSRVVVAGGAGFLGSHLCDALVGRGERVVCIDDLSTGSFANVAHLVDDPAFSFVEADVSQAVPVEGSVDAVCHLASAASPPAYLARPFETLAAGSEGTRRLLELAGRSGARFLLASTSEIYGDPEVHPQVESYRGAVDPTGPRSVYDEAKRFAEAMTMAYQRFHGIDTHIVRIFNTYGERMRLDDGRVLPNFVGQALRGEPLTVYGEGMQTRSFCYVSDLVDGIFRLLFADEHEPVNLGNPNEVTILDFAKEILQLTGSASTIVYKPLPADDPKVRRPDISRARRLLSWEPKVDRHEGLRRTVSYYRTKI